MPPSRGFSKAEFEKRLTQIQGAMSDEGIDVLLLTQEHDIRYVTGFMTPFWQSPTRPWFVIVPSSGRPQAVVPSIGARVMARCFIGGVHCFTSPAPEKAPEDASGDAPDDAPDDVMHADEAAAVLGRVIADCAGHAPVLGVMMGAETKLMMPLKDVEAVLAAIGQPEMVDATAIMRDARMVKSPQEIAKIRYVCGLASGVFESLPSWFEAGAERGMCLEDIFRRFKIDALKGGVDDVAYLVGAAEAGGYSDIISPPWKSVGVQEIESGAVLMLDTGCVWDGYFCDFDRNYGFGSVAAEVLEAYELLWHATEDALLQLRPGMTAAEVFGIMHRRLKPIEARGADARGADARGAEVGRYGHGLGSQLTEPPSHIGWDTTVLAENMVLTLEPSLVISDGKMMVHEENIVLAADGAEVLSHRAPPTLPIIKT